MSAMDHIMASMGLVSARPVPGQIPANALIAMSTGQRGAPRPASERGATKVMGPLYGQTVGRERQPVYWTPDENLTAFATGGRRIGRVGMSMKDTEANCAAAISELLHVHRPASVLAVGDEAVALTRRHCKGHPDCVAVEVGSAGDVSAIPAACRYDFGIVSGVLEGLSLVEGGVKPSM